MLNRLVHMLLTAIVWLSLSALLTGCASISSSVDDQSAVRDGLVYRMPKKDIQVFITLPKDPPPAPANAASTPKDKKKNTPAKKAAATGQNTATQDVVNAASAPNDGTIVVQAGPAYPDLSTRFVLDYQRNFIGTNKVDVKINDRGLLTSAGAQTTNGAADLVTAIGKAVGERQTYAALEEASKKQTCKPGQTYSITFPVSQLPFAEASSLCLFSITAQRLFLKGGTSVGTNSGRSTFRPGHKQAGIFYRESLPYKITVKDQAGNSRQFVVFSPSEAPISFLPIKRSVFADNNAQLTFTDGMPSGYSQSTDGELVAFFKLPATVISAYFSAVGDMFAKIKGNAVNEKQYLDALNALAVSQLSRKACADAALAKKTPEEIRAACMDTSTAQSP